ncbi:uncharacterized protein BO72DRAFT_529018 [Aspergillus fijiensis CBS 313.89]|uniref:Uncharacterized protein n=1 Tax=Aspergillus fijiensis CBS 313.89 TaxID=1448319 RepID=A0A8G1RKJ4_9EURO|nr:uncharacterized protein BO72DRAFT_529018 [Aspergillus fijiensis CBS 313.89]RAK75697.1 hypothetical protein BO72DRAFT_529018 [Aspergillus fijiensis CBS 313.89]
MCSFQVRVYGCGHYVKNLSNPCKDAERRQSVCETGITEIACTTGTRYCGIPGCDRKQRLRREGPLEIR